MGKVDLNKKQKKESLLNTAFSLFTSKGFQNTSISDIVKEAGVAKGTFYLYFTDTGVRPKPCKPFFFSKAQLHYIQCPH